MPEKEYRVLRIGHISEESTMESEFASSSDAEKSEGARGGYHSVVRWSESVYDETFLTPLRRGNGYMQDGRWRYKCRTLLHVLGMLVLNAALQTGVLLRIITITKSKTFTLQLAVGQVCEPLDQDYVNVLTKGTRRPDFKMIDCGMLAWTVLMVDQANIDMNRDGYWDAPEVQTYATLAEARPGNAGRQANLQLLLSRLLVMAERGSLRAVRSLPQEAVAEATANFTRLPVDYVRQQLPVIEICGSLVTEEHCPNLETTGILKSRLAGATAEDRIRECRHLQGTCEDLFGERYMFYEGKAKELCGDTMTVWHYPQRIRTILYETSYFEVDSKDSMMKPSYIVFLGLMLLIWVGLMASELRELVEWWVMLCSMPDIGSADCLSKAEGEEEYVVVGLPAAHKWTIIILNAVPRTIVALFLVYNGARFLMMSSSYGDLILNAVALSFLLEIDNILFKAAISSSVKEMVAQTKAWVRTVECPLPERWLASVVIMFLFVIVMMSEVPFYFEEGGMLQMGVALTCLCQGEGEHCSIAYVLRGNHSMEEVLATVQSQLSYR